MRRLAFVVAVVLGAGLAAAAALGSVAPSRSAGGSLVSSTHHPTPGARGAVYVVRADGTGLRRLTPASETNTVPAWSPNGEKPAWIHTRLNPKNFDESPTSVWVANADGSGLARRS
jgi:Tol biopolymer transport system component